MAAAARKLAWWLEWLVLKGLVGLVGWLVGSLVLVAVAVAE